MGKETLKYTNGEITIVWKPSICQHSGICARGLATVFDPRRKPWIDPLAADTNTIREQIKKCPSGALQFFMNNEGPESNP